MTTARVTTSLCSLLLLFSKVVGFLPSSTPFHKLSYGGESKIQPLTPSSSSIVKTSASSSSLLWGTNVPFNEGNITVPRNYIPTDQSKEIQESYTLSYKIARPMALSSRQAAPIVVLHGGPSVPSNYLYPLVDVIPYRSIVFYDQIGCGQSSQPQDINAYSIDKAIDDLELLLKKIGVRRFHLYGQSFGGILAFEYLKRSAERNTNTMDDEGCLSVILSSTPTNVTLVEEEANRLLSNLKQEHSNDDGDDGDQDPTLLAEEFRKEHQCRTSEMPVPLKEAYENAGSVWRGTSAIQNYVATKAANVDTNVARMPSALVLRGEYDFVTDQCIEGWISKTDPLFNHKFVRSKTLEGCSHHGLLENGHVYGELVDSYFTEYD